MSEELEIREAAKRWASTLHFDAAFTARIHVQISIMPLEKKGMAYCRACESVLCGACGNCHSLDIEPSNPMCPNDGNTFGADCNAWFQAHKGIYYAVKDQRGAGF